MSEASRFDVDIDLGVVGRTFENGMLFELQAALRSTRPGQLFALTSIEPSVPENLERWARLTGNSIVEVSHESSGTRFVMRNGPADKTEAPGLGTRLWLYTNFDCNLACDYCCVRSSPKTERRALGLDSVRAIAEQAPALGVSELLLTGGEPFLLPDLPAMLEACSKNLPTTVLTNGLLLKGRRLASLEPLDRTRVTLQISLDSATPEIHDAHRGNGTWQRAWDGIRAARQAGFRVRLAATVTSAEQGAAFEAMLDAEGVASEDRVIRPIARRGLAANGIALSRADLQPEITITHEGVFWHPVGADDRDLFVTPDALPLRRAFELVKAAFERDRELENRLLTVFHCA